MVSQAAPKKRFGQHFLLDTQVLHQILLAINPGEIDQIIEIGPGQGALTEYLLTRVPKLTALEIDRDLIDLLHKKFGSRLNLHNTDVLHFQFDSLNNGTPWRIVGNLPYNISTPLLFHLLQSNLAIRDMIFLLQKEVAERISTPPGTKTYGRLSVMAQYFCDARIFFRVPPEAFSPPPKVDSALIKLTPFGTLPYPALDFEWFSRLVTQAFSQRRKTLRQSLRHLVKPASYLETDIDPLRRPETLSVKEFVALSNHSLTLSSPG